MPRQNRRKPIVLENIEIIDTATKGKSVARHDGVIIFIKGGVPGDICNITVFKRRKKYWEANINQIVKKSKSRIDPICEHFGSCGGCKWQNMNYQSQLKFKQNEVVNNLTRIGGITISKYNQIIGCEQEYFYRNKMEFTFSNKRWLTQEEVASNSEIKNKDALGFHVPGMFDKVIDIKKCHLQKEPSNKIRLAVKEFADNNKLPYFDLRNQTGLLRNLLIRTSTTNELMVLVQFFNNDTKKIKLLMDFIKDTFNEITSLLYTINTKGNNTLYDQDILCYSGKDYITEEIDDLVFKIGPKSFFQTNSKQAKKLYSITRELAEINEKDIVYDLYTGTGTIAQFIAKKAKMVIGIDSVEEGIMAAYENAKFNNIKNCTFYTGDMKDIFSDEFINKNGHPNVIITDPPRDGMHKKVIEQILNILPQRIVYVSCNSATQARDISIMNEKYNVTKIQTVDMFPQTHHVENIVVLELI
jgi:23S rRNA (uracil1939-C5)-methyltransferase|tara:strand:+ start:3519 stop:4931 length:1413 start_codon:yes stop_codon:yes gene_type:complete